MWMVLAPFIGRLHCAKGALLRRDERVAQRDVDEGMAHRTGAHLYTSDFLSFFNNNSDISPFPPAVNFEFCCSQKDFRFVNS